MPPEGSENGGEGLEPALFLFGSHFCVERSIALPGSVNSGTADRRFKRWIRRFLRLALTKAD